MGRGRGRRGGGCKGGVRRWGCERVEGRGDWVEGGEGGGGVWGGPPATGTCGCDRMVFSTIELLVLRLNRMMLI